VAVTHDDVRNIAALARLAVSADRLDALVRELNGILGHMEQLDEAEGADEAVTAGMRLAADVGPSVPLTTPISAFAPEWRDGFFLVPRLATHGDVGAAGEGDE